MISFVIQLSRVLDFEIYMHRWKMVSKKSNGEIGSCGIKTYKTRLCSISKACRSRYSR